MNVESKEPQNPIVEAYNLLCKNLYITSAIAVIEEAFSTMMLSKNSDLQQMAKLTDDQMEVLGRDSRELLMELIEDTDGNMLPEAIRQFNDDRTGFQENVRYRAIERGLSLRGDMDTTEQGDR